MFLANMNEKLHKQIKFIEEIDKVKSIFRQTRLFDNSRFENDAEHSWHLAVMALVLAEYSNEPGTDICKVVKMVLIHDLVEIDAGDTFIYDEKLKESKEEREKTAAERIFGLLPDELGTEFKNLWEEFEKRETKEAKFAAALDRLEPMLQNSKTEGHTWKKYGINRSQVLGANKIIKDGSEELWNFALSLVDACVQEGCLIED